MKTSCKTFSFRKVLRAADFRSVRHAAVRPKSLSVIKDSTVYFRNFPIPMSSEKPSTSAAAADEPQASGGQKPNADKKARVFDLEAMFSQTVATAQEHSRKALEKAEAEQEADPVKLQKMHISKQPSADGAEKNADSQAESDDEVIGPPLPPAMQEPEPQAGPSGSRDDSGVEDNDEDYDSFEISIEKIMPTVAEAVVKHGIKPISAIALDRAGSKFATGGYDYMVKLYDFAQMDSAFRPFRECQPAECHVIQSLAYNANGEYLLVASNSAQVKLLDRKGTQWTECVKGDQFLVDSKNTKGHTAAITGACWHPHKKDEFLTSSEDSTVRTWSTDDYKQVTRVINTHKGLIRVKAATGKKCRATACTYSHDGKLILAGCDDGSLQLWNYGRYVGVNTAKLVRQAHAAGTITSVAFSYDNINILSRAMDDTLKLWDLRMFKDPVNMVSGLENNFIMTECCFSPRDELCVTGVSSSRDGAPGRLVAYEKTTFKPVYQIEYPDTSAVRVQWHPKINQLFVGLSDGGLHVYYDPERSSRGITGCVSKTKKRERTSEIISEQMIISPLTMEMFQPRGEEGQEKEVTAWRLRKLLRQQARDPNKKFRKPAQMPMSGPSAGGRIAEGHGSYHAYILQEMGVARNKDLFADTDVRSSILRHAEAAAADPQFINNAYKRTQPVPIFQEETTEPEKKDEELEPVYKKSKPLD